jgi:hypothetical protein
MSIPLTAVNFATQNDTPIVVRSLDYASQCCCDCPCVEWLRFTSGSPIFNNPPPPSFPCCGLAQGYSLSQFGEGFGSLPEEQNTKYRLSGSLFLSANLNFPCAWNGSGASIEYYDTFENTWLNFDGQSVSASVINRPTSCQYEVILNIDPLGFAITFRKSRGPLEGPEGIYSASGSQYGSLSIS